jgi:hypothetical protein
MGGTPTPLDDSIASFSSKGPTLVDRIVKPDLVTPGNLAVSLLTPNANLPKVFPRTQIQKSSYDMLGGPGYSTKYFRLSGTSMAGPVGLGGCGFRPFYESSRAPRRRASRPQAGPMRSASIAQLSSSGEGSA